MQRMTTRTWVALIAVALIINLIIYAPGILIALTGQNTTAVDLPYSEFRQQLNDGNVASVKLAGPHISGVLKKAVAWPQPPVAGKTTTSKQFTSLAPTDPIHDDTLITSLITQGVEVTAQTEAPPAWASILGGLISILPVILFVAFMFLFIRQARQGQQNALGFGQSKAKLYSSERPGITFKDVAGVDEAKQELAEVVDFLKDPMRFQKLGARIPRGVLLVGPPGTGKTLLARAVAGEAGVPFFSISATEFVEMFVGVGASRVRDLFDKAKKAAPAIVFVDEIDSVGRQRGAGYGNVNDEREQTLNQLLVEMDGFEQNQGVIVVAATNRPDVLDPALLRPGRFDREVTVERPDRAGREAILKIHSRNVPLASDVHLDVIARGTPGFAGADLANLVNEAALVAARQNKTTVDMRDFSEAEDKVLLGVRRGILMTEDERRVIAYHEGGHAIVAAFCGHADPIQKVTIVPRGRSLGVTQMTPERDTHNYTRTYLLDRLAVGMVGRAAESLMLKEITTGAENDLKESAKLARRMVTEWGMTSSLPPVAFDVNGNAPFLGRQLAMGERTYSEETAATIDREVERFIADAYDRASVLIQAHLPELEALVARLLDDEIVEGPQLADIFRRSPTEAVPVGA